MEPSAADPGTAARGHTVPRGGGERAKEYLHQELAQWPSRQGKSSKRTEGRAWPRATGETETPSCSQVKQHDEGSSSNNICLYSNNMIILYLLS